VVDVAVIGGRAVISNAKNICRQFFRDWVAT
jgi:hypothetical protein